jgi:phosphonopyruvate decarboxylase
VNVTTSPSPTLLRTEAVARLADARGTCLTVVTMQAMIPWTAGGHADERNINLLGSMGSASAIGLGLALARPDQRVLVLDGDGSLLMQLGSLVTIAGAAPANLVHVVFENGTYETSGGQAVPARERADLCALALASGYRHAVRYASLDEMADVEEVLAREGPTFVSLTITGQGTVVRDARRGPDFATQMETMRATLAAPAGSAA